MEFGIAVMTRRLQLLFVLVLIVVKRLTVQSQAEFSLLPLDKSGFPSAANNTFLNCHVRDK